MAQELLAYGEVASVVFVDSVGIRGEAVVWRENFGFDGSAAHRTISTSAALGYSEEQSDGKAYYTIPSDDVRRELQNINPSVPLRMNAVYVEDGVLLRMPPRVDVAEVLATVGDQRPSLADDEAFRALAESLGDPLSGVLMTRSEALDSDRTNQEPQLTKQEGWGTLHEWEAMAVGYGISGEESWWAFSLYYADAGQAASASNELLSRMQSYVSLIPDRQERNLSPGRSYPEQPFAELCDSLSVNQAGASGGSMLTVTCDLKPDTPAGAWDSFVIFRDIGFLVP